MEVVSEKNRELNLFIDENKVKFIGNYAVVDAIARPNELADEKLRKSTFPIKGVIDRNYNEALFGFDRVIGDIMRYGSRDFIVYKKATYINDNNQNRFQHFKVSNVGFEIVNEIIATEMKPTIIGYVMQGVNFLYNLKEGKAIFNIGAFIRPFKRVDIHYEAEVIDYVFTEENSYEIKFYINEKGEKLSMIYCDYLNKDYSRFADYNQIKWEIKRDLLEAEAKRKTTQDQIKRLRGK